MPQINPTPCPTEPKAFDALIGNLSKEVAEAKNQSNDFYSKAKRLAVFSLNCDCEKSEAMPEDP